MEQEILKRGIGAKCKFALNGGQWDAKIVMINIHTKEVGVIVMPDGDYLQKPYKYITFE